MKTLRLAKIWVWLISLLKSAFWDIVRWLVLLAPMFSFRRNTVRQNCTTSVETTCEYFCFIWLNFIRLNSEKRFSNLIMHMVNLPRHFAGFFFQALVENSRLEVLCEKDALKNLPKFLGKHLCWSHRPATF